MAKKSDNTQAEMVQVEKSIGVILQIGVVISATIIIIGLIIGLVTGGTGYPGQTFPTHLGPILTGVAQAKPVAIMMLGLFCLILTPVLRVVVSIYAFAKEHDHLYVLITSTVLVILAFAMILGYLDI